MFKVMVNVWSNKGYIWGDCLTGEYSGIIHKTLKEAEEELREVKENLDDCWIEEV